MGGSLRTGAQVRRIDIDDGKACGVMLTTGETIAECKVAPSDLAALLGIIESGTINARQGKEVFAEMLASGKKASLIVEEKGLKQESDLGAIEALCAQSIAANPKAVEEVRAGKAASINFLKGQVMKLSQGKANPTVVGEILTRLLSA